jgi:hypothetical protein
MGTAFIVVELFVALNAPAPLKLPVPKLPVPKLPVPKLPVPKLPVPKLPVPKLPVPKLPVPTPGADIPEPLFLDAFTASSLPVLVEGGRAAFVMDVVSKPPRWPPLAPPSPELAEVKLAASDWDWED